MQSSQKRAFQAYYGPHVSDPKDYDDMSSRSNVLLYSYAACHGRVPVVDDLHGAQGLALGAGPRLFDPPSVCVQR
jgi:hypothetical protein